MNNTNFNWFPYQRAALNAIYDAQVRGLRRVLYALPTGTGKTYVFCGLIADNPGPVLIITHTKELIDQVEQSLADFKRFGLLPENLRIGREQGKERAPENSQVVVASLASLYRNARLSWFKPSLIIYDEGHHSPAKHSRRILERFGVFDEGGPLLVGCTATPHRMDKKELVGTESAIFQEQVYQYSILDAMKERHICSIRAFRGHTEVDLDGIPTVDGDFSIKSLGNAVNTPQRNGVGFDLWRSHGEMRPTIVFCADVNHAMTVADLWRDKGYRVECVTAEMPEDERKVLVKRLETGETQVVVNVRVLTEGFNFPPFSCVLMLRPTKSWSLYVQMSGRGTRNAAGKQDLIILDMADNTKRHSLIMAPALVGLPSNYDAKGKTLLESLRDTEGVKSARQQDDARHRLNNRELLPGERFGEWTVLGSVRTNPDGKIAQECQCGCGTKRFLPRYRLLAGKVKSCGQCKLNKIQLGSVFGQLEVIGVPFRKEISPGQVTSVVLVRCNCTNKTEKIVRAGALVSKNLQSCGCRVHGENSTHRKHGDSGSPLYRKWQKIKTSCEGWNDFPAFKQWALSFGYSESMALERINKSGPASPENSRWVSIKPKNHVEYLLNQPASSDAGFSMPPSPKGT